MNFEYQAKNTDKQLVSGYIEANDLKEANIRLRAQNLQPINVYLSQLDRVKPEQNLDRHELYFFFSTYLYYHHQGFSELSIIRKIRSHNRSNKIAKCCDHLDNLIANGLHLQEAVEQSPIYFNEFTRYLIHSMASAEDSMEYRINRMMENLNVQILSEEQDNLIQSHIHQILLVAMFSVAFLSVVICNFENPALALGVLYFLFICSFQLILHPILYERQVYLKTLGKVYFQSQSYLMLNQLRFLLTSGMPIKNAILLVTNQTAFKRYKNVIFQDNSSLSPLSQSQNMKNDIDLEQFFFSLLCSDKIIHQAAQVENLVQIYNYRLNQARQKCVENLTFIKSSLFYFICLTGLTFLSLAFKLS